MPDPRDFVRVGQLWKTGGWCDEFASSISLVVGFEKYESFCSSKKNEDVRVNMLKIYKDKDGISSGTKFSYSLLLYFGDHSVKKIERFQLIADTDGASAREVMGDF